MARFLSRRQPWLTAAAVAAISAGILARAPQVPRDAAAPVAGTAVIGGVVIDEVSGRPIRRANVTVVDTTAPQNPLSTLSDDAGRFVLRSLPAARYTVSAGKGGYLGAAYGATRAAGPMQAASAPQPIPLVAGQQVTDIVLKLAHGGVITGVIVDPNNQPARGVTVALAFYGRSYTTGERALINITTGSRNAETDDRGVYRLYGIPPGDYVVAAESGLGRMSDLRVTTDADVQMAIGLARAGSSAPVSSTPAVRPRRQTVGYVPVFYPGTSIASEAATVSVKAGEERSGIDFQLQLVPSARISGTLAGLDGQPAPGAVVRLINNGLSMPLLGSPGLGASSTTDSQGRFNFPGVVPGPYALAVRTGSPSGRGANPASPPLWALSDVTVRGGDVDVAMTLQQGVTVSGRITIDPSSSAGSIDFSRARVSLQPPAGTTTIGVSSVAPDANGEFAIPSVVPGRYKLSASLAGGPGGTIWAVKSSTVAGHDTLDAPVEIPAADLSDALITMTDRITEIAGKVLDGSGTPPPVSLVIVFSADQAQWTWQSRRIQTARTGRDGAFVVRNLPPGDYLVTVVSEAAQGDWFDPAFLTPLVATSTKLSLAEGEKKIQDVRIK